MNVVVDGGRALVARTEPDGTRLLRLQLESGLYQLSVVADGAAFDWERLYQVKDNSVGEKVRTGPWDFDDDGVPLLPAYRVMREGRFVGVWVMQRISLEDLERRRFRGRMAFRMTSGGECELRLVPLPGSEAVPWTKARVEPDPEDQLEPFLEQSMATAWDSWVEESFWKTRRVLPGSPGFHENEIRESLREATEKPDSRTALGLFCAARLWPEETSYLRSSLEILETWSRLPAFGRTHNELAYGYRGDMDAMHALRTMVQAHFILRPFLPDSLRQAMERQLAVQASYFVENALITRDYWGGSVIQDHGWQSLPGAAAAIMNGRHFIPGAAEMLEYLVPRSLRSFTCMPRDGTLGSHGDFWRYLARSNDFREAWLAATGRDAFDEFPFRSVIEFVTGNRLPDGIRRFDLARDCKPMLGGTAFFLGMAQKFDDPMAWELAWQTLSLPLSVVADPALPAAARGLNFKAWVENKFEGLLAVTEPLTSPSPPTASKPGLRVFKDSSVAFFRSPDGRLLLGLKCGPHNGWHAHANAQGPCDRIATPGGGGHFALAVDGQPVLVTPESPWQLRADLRSVLLINGHGQTGADIGYPNCLPSFQHRGEKIELAEWDGKAGRIVLDLAPAYPAVCGVLEYRREFVLNEAAKICCRDTVRLAQPSELCWLFQGANAAAPVREDGPVVRFGELLRLTARTDAGWEVAIRETPLVRYLRRDTGRTFIRAEFRPGEPQEEIRAEFLLAPLPGHA